MLIELAQNKFARKVLYLAAISLVISLIATVTCDGPIDQIFMNWRDKTSCLTTPGCIVGIGYGEGTALVAALSSIFLVFVAVIYGVVLFIKKVKKGRSCRN